MNKKYWEDVRDRAASEIHGITGCEVHCEASLKNAVSHAFRCGSYLEAANTVVEAGEWMMAYLKLKELDQVPGAK